MQNGTDRNLVRKFDHSLIVSFMIVNIFNIDNMNCDQNIKYEIKLEHLIKYNILIDKYVFKYNNSYF